MTARPTVGADRGVWAQELNDYLVAVPITAQAGTTYTLASGDEGTVLKFTSASAVTVTIPTNASVAFLVGTQIFLYQYGAGQVTVDGSLVTLRSPGSQTKLATQYGQATLTKIATDEWTLEGNVST